MCREIIERERNVKLDFRYQDVAKVNDDFSNRKYCSKRGDNEVKKASNRITSALLNV